jgi:hypothetical protein
MIAVGRCRSGPLHAATFERPKQNSPSKNRNKKKERIPRSISSPEGGGEYDKACKGNRSPDDRIVESQSPKQGGSHRNGHQGNGGRLENSTRRKENKKTTPFFS